MQGFSMITIVNGGVGIANNNGVGDNIPRMGDLDNPPLQADSSIYESDQKSLNTSILYQYWWVTFADFYSTRLYEAVVFSPLNTFPINGVDAAVNQLTGGGLGSPTVDLKTFEENDWGQIPYTINLLAPPSIPPAFIPLIYSPTIIFWELLGGVAQYFQSTNMIDLSPYENQYYIVSFAKMTIEQFQAVTGYTNSSIYIDNGVEKFSLIDMEKNDSWLPKLATQV